MVAFEILHLIASLKTLSSNEGTRLGGRIWGGSGPPTYTSIITVITLFLLPFGGTMEELRGTSPKDGSKQEMTPGDHVVHPHGNITRP